MTNKYLEKIATSGKIPDRERRSKAFLGFIGTGVALGAAQQAVTKKFLKDSLATKSHSGADANTVRHFIQKNKIDVSLKGPDRGSGPYYIPKNSPIRSRAHINGRFSPRIAELAGVHINKPHINYDTVMHELGHAKDLKGTSYKRFAAVGGGLKVTPLIGLGMLANEKTRDYAAPVAAISGIRSLVNEGAANYHAYQGIRSHKGVSSANKYLKRVVPLQMLGYGLHTAAEALPIAAANYFLSKDKK